MRSHAARAVVSGLLFASVACTQTTSSTTGKPNYKITLKGLPREVIADMSSAATMTATITGSPNPSGNVQFETEAGKFDGGDDANAGKTITVPISDHSTALASLKCINDLGKPLVGNMRVTAKLLAGGNIPEEVTSTRVDITCKAATDSSSIAFLSPGPGDTVADPNAVEVDLAVTEFDGSGADTATNPDSITVQGLQNTFITANPTQPGVRGLNQHITLSPMAGQARFYVKYPGDTATNAGPISLDLKVKFKNRLGVEKEATQTISYAQAANNSSIHFVDAVPSDMSNVNIVASNPPHVVISAGADASVDLKVEIRDRAGLPLPDGTEVRFSCIPSDPSAQGALVACESLSGISLTLDGSTTVVDNLNRAGARSVTEPATANTPLRSVAVVKFKARSNAVPAEVTIEAAFSVPGLDREVSTGNERARVTLVDANTISLGVEVQNRTIRSDSGATGKLVFSARKGTGGLANALLCVRLDPSSSSRAVLRDSGDDNDRPAVVVGTDADGKAEVIVAPTAANVRGPALVYYTLVDTMYTATLDDNTANMNQATVCEQAAAAAARFDGIELLQITREPILGAIRFVSADPSLIGTRGSSALPTNSRVQFQVFDDENHPIGRDQAVEFTLDNNVDANASVTPLALTDDQGIVECSVTSGNQAASLVVRARAERQGTVITASSDPISVIGGRPAWANSVVTASVYHTWGGKAVLGVDDLFGASLEPRAVTVNFTLVDRFSNRVQRDMGGYQVQWRAEGGNIPASALATATGTSSVPYRPGGTFAQDVRPRTTEQRVVVPYREIDPTAPQDTMRVANESDGRVSILAAVRGEESFIDNNGDGAFQRPFADSNNNHKYDGPSEDCVPCGTAACTTIAEVSDPNKRDYARNRDLVESFVDLPEPYVDGDEDGLRANCDLPEFMLPVHHDLYKRAAGIGTYCNPYRDDEPLDTGLIDNFPETGVEFTAADCRAHWCPQWDPQWSCRDTAPPAGVFGPNNPSWTARWDEAFDSDPAHHKTPEAIFGPGNAIVGGRIVWCSDWRYLDMDFTQTNNRGFRDPVAQTVGMPGILGMLVDDQTPPGDGSYSMTDPIGEVTWTVSGGTGTFTYRAPGDPMAGPGKTVNLTSEQQIKAIELTSGGGTRKLYLRYDPTLLSRTTRPPAQFRVRRGALQAPVSENFRNYLRFLYTEQFIDGNNNGEFDEANGCYDTDTLIWKQIIMTANASPFVTPPEMDITLPANGTLEHPRVDGVPNHATPRSLCLHADMGVCDTAAVEPLESYVHLNPGHTNEIVSATDHSGSSDFFFIDNTHPFAQIDFRVADVNGTPVNAYGFAPVSAVCHTNDELSVILVPQLTFNKETGRGTLRAVPLILAAPHPMGGVCQIIYPYSRGEKDIDSDGDGVIQFSVIGGINISFM